MLTAGHAFEANFAVAKVGLVVADTYRIKRHLGSGASSHVFEAEHVRLGRIFALKLLRDELAEHGSTARRFRREASAIAAIRSEHVVAVTDCGEHSGVPFLVMELCEGEDLRTLLDREHKLPSLRAFGIVMEAARGVQAMHRAGIVHRDLKPENLFLTRRSSGEEWCKVLDLGVAKSANSCRTKEGAVVGTIRYMSPEQLTDSSSVDASADIYALGAILYECLSGVVPHSTSSIQQLMFDILNREPLPLRQLAPGLPNSVCELVTSCISKDSAARPSAHELAEALADELAPLPMSGSATTMSDVSPEAGWRAPQSSSRRSMALAACAVVSALGGAGIQAATSSAPVHANPPSPPPIATLGTTVACLAPTPPSNVTLGPALAGAPPGVAATRRSITARVASAPLTVGDAEPANVIRSGTFDMSNPYSE